jgi:uncharacterized membrane protein
MTLSIYLLSQRLMAQSAPNTTQKTSASQSTKIQPAAPAAPQSTHYPILVLAFGSDPTWSLRIGQKGPERLDRLNYPPIALDPAEVTHDAGADSWTYHAKDSATGAGVAVHLSREVCSGPTPPVTAPIGGGGPVSSAPAVPTKFTFRASVEHTQLGTLSGCARIAAELFPRINNQPLDDDDDTQNKPPAPTVVNFKSPVAVAYINTTKQLVLKRGSVIRTVAQDGYQPSLSHDGKRLLYTRDEKSPERSILLYDSATGKSTELLRGPVQQAVWSPDDTMIAFIKFDGAKWRLWSMPVNAPDNAAQVYAGDIATLHGWSDATTILADDLGTLFWIGMDGTAKESLSLKEVYGDSFGASSADTIRVHPLNPDLLLVSAEWLKPPTGAPTDPQLGGGFSFFLYEIAAKRRVVMSPPNMLSEYAEWSRDGLQIFFTGTDSSKRSATYRIFWDGTGLRKYADGLDFAIGQ